MKDRAVLEAKVYTVDKVMAKAELNNCFCQSCVVTFCQVFFRLLRIFREQGKYKYITV